MARTAASCMPCIRAQTTLAVWRSSSGGASKEALAAHLESEHVQAVLARAPELFGESGDIVIYEAMPGGETRKGSLAAHAAG